MRPQFAPFERAVSLLVVMAATWFAAVPVAQSPQVGPNVNMVSGTTWPEGDPFLQRQNEGSIAVSTRNPLHLLAGANDYRTVDLPGLSDGRVTGDAWLGLFKSFDGGMTWKSTLLPGYPQDPAGTAPLFGYQAGADATVRAGTNGLFYYSGIVFDRSVGPQARANGAKGQPEPGKKDDGKNRGRAAAAGTAFGKSAVFVARFIDNNNRPNGDPIDYVGATIVKSSPDVVFIDKPWLAVDIPRYGAPNCTIPATANASAQTFRAGRAYVTFTEVEETASGTLARIMFSRSVDCGGSWSEPRVISTGHQLNQGSSMAINPLTGEIYVTWRRLKFGTQQGDAVMVAKSTDGGNTFTLPVKVANVTPFDQGTSFISARTTGYPTITLDYFPRVYIAWSSRGVGPNGDARIVLSTSDGRVTRNAPDDDDFGTAKNDAMSWSLPVAVDNPPVVPDVPTGRGHQVMPSMSFAAGKLMLVYYDLRLDHTKGVYQCDPAVPGSCVLVETREPAGDLPGSPQKVFSPFIAEAEHTGYNPDGTPTFSPTLSRRHTVDIVAAQASPGATPVFSTSRVSQYRAGSRPGSLLVEQLQYNPPLLPLFACGASSNPAHCRPFLGDYIDIAPSPAFRTDPFGFWIPNVLPTTTPVFHTMWTDNRDVRPPADGNWANYAPPTNIPGLPPGGQSIFDPGQTRPVCTPAAPGMTNVGMRNQNVYTARVTGGLYVSAHDNSKQLGGIQRAFAVSVQNATGAVRSFRLRLRFPNDVTASFLQFQPLTQLDVTIAPRSTISRPVFVTSANRRGQVTVDVNEIDTPGGSVVSGGLAADMVLNPDITNPDITNPDITNQEVYNPDITNPDITNPDITNPDITNPDITNPDITNPDITNPDITNPDITNGSLTDTTWEVTNDGTTSASYAVKLLLNGTVPQGFKFQLILHRVYTTPTPHNCNLGLQSHNVLIANIRNPEFSDAADLANPDITNPDITNATMALGPGERGKITLRVVDPNRFDATTFNAAAAVTPAVVSHAVNTAEAALGSTTPPIAMPGSGTGVLFVVQPPAQAVVGAPIAPAVRVQARDVSTGAPMSGFNVTLHLDPNPTGATLTGNTAMTDALGVATFPNLAINDAGEGFSLLAVVDEGPAGFSRTFDVAGPTIEVTNTNDGGAGSLRSAILLANDTETRPGVDRIVFNIPGPGPHTITLFTALPAITDPAIIDGTSQPGYNGSPLIEVDGSELFYSEGSQHGLLLLAGNTTMRGLSLTGFPRHPIEIWATDGGNRIQANYIGVDPSGASSGNSGTGVVIFNSPRNLIGGPTRAQGNVISGNTGEGVLIEGNGAYENVVQGNYIGTDASGAAAIGNSLSGVYIRYASSNQVIGNLISGNLGFAGVAICGNSTSICGGGIGEFWGDNVAINNFVQGNSIGVSASGAPLGNAGPGVTLDGAFYALIGGTSAEARNVVAHNAAGVVVFGESGAGHQILGNAIHSNTGPGIDLAWDGVTFNDYGDGPEYPPDEDTGPNELQNFPDLYTAVMNGNTVVTGQLSSVPNADFRIEVFVNGSCEASGHGEGQRLLGSFTVTTDAAGLAYFNEALRATTLGDVLTATATRINNEAPGSTSEFSGCRTVTATPPPIVN